MANSPIVVQGIPIENNIENNNIEREVNNTENNTDQEVNTIHLYHEEFVEIDEISAEGWLCIICGCFFCPGLNLLGLCMTEKRLVPVNSI